MQMAVDHSLNDVLYDKMTMFINQTKVEWQQQISRLHYRSRSVALSQSILEVLEVGFFNPFQRCMSKTFSKYREEVVGGYYNMAVTQQYAGGYNSWVGYESTLGYEPQSDCQS